MAWIVSGAGGVQWHAADWVVRNAFEFILPALRNAGGDTVADHCRTALARGGHAIDLSSMLSEPQISAIWRNAVAAALHAAQIEPAARWHEAARQPEFIAAIARLETLALGGGNALIADLARNLSAL